MLKQYWGIAATDGKRWVVDVNGRTYLFDDRRLAVAQLSTFKSDWVIREVGDNGFPVIEEQMK